MKQNHLNEKFSETFGKKALRNLISEDIGMGWHFHFLSINLDAEMV